MQKCCYGVGRVWIRCGYGEAPLGPARVACLGASSNQIATCLGRFGMVAGSDLLLAPRGHTVRIWRVSTALKSARTGTDHRVSLLF